jgi:hypothetical protein
LLDATRFFRSAEYVLAKVGIRRTSQQKKQTRAEQRLRSGRASECVDFAADFAS